MTKLNTILGSIGIAATLFAAGNALATDITGAGATWTCIDLLV